MHVQVEAQLDQWRQEDGARVDSRAQVTTGRPVPALLVRPLTPALLRRLTDAHYLQTYEGDFEWRGSLWKEVNQDEQAFWRGEIIPHPQNDWQQCRGRPYSYYAHLMEEPVLDEVFLYCVFQARKDRLQRLQRQFQLGDTNNHEKLADALLKSKEIALPESDRSRLLRKLMEAEIKALEDLVAGDESKFDGIFWRQATDAPSPPTAVPTQHPKPGQAMSELVDQYLEDMGREREDQDSPSQARRATRVHRDNWGQAGQRLHPRGRRQVQGRSDGLARDPSSKAV